MFDLVGPFRVGRPPSEDDLEFMSKNSMWTDYEKTSPPWLRLLRKDDLLLVHTAHLDDMECVSEWLG
ncbi:MAG TPA: hypothetical protein VFM18_14320, partial [Methanosarcina sp.]|nr:hypothetical protein [Methanosarcina sp.]